MQRKEEAPPKNEPVKPSPPRREEQKPPPRRQPSPPRREEAKPAPSGGKPVANTDIGEWF